MGVKFGGYQRDRDKEKPLEDCKWWDSRVSDLMRSWLGSAIGGSGRTWPVENQPSCAPRVACDPTYPMLSCGLHICGMPPVACMCIVVL